MMDLNFNHLRNFHCVATARSLVDAARKLEMSPSTLSEQIRLLERRLGVQLFARTASGLKLSEAGRRLVEQTQLIWAAGERIESGLVSDRDDVRLRLEVGITRTITHTFATRVLRSLFEHEGVIVSTAHGDLPELAREVIAGELDMVLSDAALMDDANGKLVVDKLGTSPLVVAAPAKLARRERTLERVNELPFVHYTRVCALRSPVENFLAANALVPKVLAEVDDVGLMCEVAATNGAWCIVPQVSPCLDGSNGQLALVAKLGDGFAAEIHVLRHRTGRTELILSVIARLQESIEQLHTE